MSSFRFKIKDENYDLSKLNIVAVADIKFEDESKRDFYGYNCVTPNDLGILDYDVLLIANFDYEYFIRLSKGQNVCKN